MSAPQQRVEPGIWKRVGAKGRTVYLARFRDSDGRQRAETVGTLQEARRLLRARQVQVDTGAYISHEASRQTFESYARQWVESYGGKGQGFRERTRDDYRRDLERYLVPFFGQRQLRTIRRADVARFVSWLTDDDQQRERHDQENAARVAAGKRPLKRFAPLKDGTVRRIHAVLSAVLSTAKRHEVISDNPASETILPKRDAFAGNGDDDEAVNTKALTRSQLHAFMASVDPEWRVFFRLLAATGLRVSEAIALDVRNVVLDEPISYVRVRRAWGKSKGGRFAMDAPKSKRSRREVPIPASLAAELRAHILALPMVSPEIEKEYGHLVFPSRVGTPISDRNLRTRVLKPALEEAGAGELGYHAFRHAFSSMHIEAGTNVVRLSRLLGHSSVSMTLNRYSHLLDAGYGAPLDIDAEIQAGAPEDFATPEASASVNV